MNVQESGKPEKQPLTPYNISVTKIKPGIYSIGGNAAELNKPDDNDSDLKLPRVQTLLTSAILANRIMEWGNKLIEKKIDPWLFFHGVGVKIPKYDGQLIHYSGQLRFEGAPELVFWNFIEPFLERGIDEWLDHIADLCLQNGKKPELYLQTVRDSLKSCIYNVYSRMSEIDYRIHKGEASRLASEDFGENIPKRDTSENRVPMINYLNKNYECVLEATKTSSNEMGDNTKPQEKAGQGNSINEPYIKKGSKVWELCFQSKTVAVDAKLKGLVLVEHLLVHKKQEYTPLELLKATGQRGEEETESERMYSDKDIAEIKAAIEGLRGRAEFANDLEEKERLRREIEKAERELHKGRNRQGKPRKISERHRVSVIRKIGTVLNKISPENPELYNHLDTFLKRGEICSYKPDSEILWDISKKSS